MNQSFTKFDDLDVKLAQFPKLSFGEFPRCAATLAFIPHTHTLDVMYRPSFNGAFRYPIFNRR